VQLQAFNAEYVEQLKSGDPVTENHFVSYFGSLLYLKLCARLRSRQMIEDIRQETLLRVLQTLRQKNGVYYPERLGAFVNAICNHVLLEFWRAESRHRIGSAGMPDLPDPTVDLDSPLEDSERKRAVRRVLAELVPKDRWLLEAIYIEEMDKSEVCRRYGVDAGYLRVLLHRARTRFRRTYQAQLPAARARVKVQIDGVQRQVHAHDIADFDSYAVG
jgi:RNA polymerase sigma-70 factor, ECF subfamily